MRDERGSALIIALLVTFILSLLGVSFLVMARTEGSIAQNERLGLQTLYLAEAGAHVVRGWFDRPGTAFAFPSAGVVDRSLRQFLDEADPYVNPPLAGMPLYKEGIDLDAAGGDDLFDRPYRGDPAHALMGLEAGPDLRIDDRGPEGLAFLEMLSSALLGEEAVAPTRIARISRIDVFAPPYVRAGSAWTRLGIGTVAVTARLYRATLDGAEVLVGGEPDVLAQRTVVQVLNEIPYGTPVHGPLHAGGDLELVGSPAVRWGTIAVRGDVTGYDRTSPNLPPSLPRGLHSGAHVDVLWSSAPACVDHLMQVVAPGASVTDPWLRLMAHGTISTFPPDDESYCHDAAGYPPNGDCYPGSGPGPATNHCNKRQGRLVSDPEYDYEFWKNVATSGGRNVYFLVPDGAGEFLENGIGDALSFSEITNGRVGLFFFDTTDGLAPHDDDLDGAIDNLSPAIDVSGAWQSAGFVFLNTERLTLGNLTAPAGPVAVHAPGEPYHDADGDRVRDPAEPWINLVYPHTLVEAFRIDAANGAQDDGSTGVPVRNAHGPPILEAVSFRGILHTTGDVTIEGSGTLHGSVIARGNVRLGSGPAIWWADEIERGWPPPDLDLPRVTVTRWTELPWGLVVP
jgi:hypothetical protein